jgi:hypothetical protein
MLVVNRDPFQHWLEPKDKKTTLCGLTIDMLRPHKHNITAEEVKALIPCAACKKIDAERAIIAKDHMPYWEFQMQEHMNGIKKEAA